MINKYNLFHINNYEINTKELGHMLDGPIKSELEEKFAEYVGAKYACTANSASSLLEISLKFLVNGIGPQKLAINPLALPSMLPATVANIVHEANIPSIWLDDTDWVGNEYVLFDANRAMKCRGCEKTKEKNFPRIIDSAQHVSRNHYKNFSESDLVIYSFYPTKPVGGIDGGIIVTNDKEAYDYFKAATNMGFSQIDKIEEKAREIQEDVTSDKILVDKLRNVTGSLDQKEEILKKEIENIESAKRAREAIAKNQSKKRKYSGAQPSWDLQLSFPGWKANASSAQCYVALKNLEKLDDKNERLEEIRNKYNSSFNLNNTSLHLYRINVNSRDSFRVEMKSSGIQTGIHYKPLHEHEFYNIAQYPNMSKTNSEAITTVSIPFNESLTDSDLDFIINQIKTSGYLI